MILVITRLVLWCIPFALALAVFSAHAQSSMVTLLVSAESVQIGMPTSVNILIDCQIDACSAASFGLRFDSNALQIERISLGDFPASTGNTPYLIRRDIDNAAGTLTASYVTVDNHFPPVTGTGLLLVITVTALQYGEFDLEITDASVASLDGQTVLEPQTVTGILVVTPVVSLQTLTIRAESGTPDTINVSALGESEVISETLTPEVLLVEVVVNDNQPIALEIDAPGHLTCNVSDSESREIMLYAGDLNDDGLIDANDGSIVDMAHHAENESDLNGDHMVNIYELIHVGRNYGLSSGEC